MVRLRDGSLVNSAASLLISGLLAGLVLAAAAFPALAVTGLAAKAGADSFQELPADLEVVPPPETTYIYAADGKTRITGFYEENRQNVSLDQISPLMRNAIVAAEDARFYEHHGVDLKGVLRALVANSGAGKVQQGASTLTMQYVRQALTYAAKTPAERRAATEDTPARKLREIRYAISLEKKLSKEEILENYLNIAYFGHQAYGVYAASYAYFSKHPKDLSLEEAAMLAAVVRAPSVYDPSSEDKAERDAILERRNWVIKRMVEEGYVSKKEAKEAQERPITLKPTVPPNNCVDVPPKHKDWGFFCAYFLNWWKQQKQFGANATEREANLKSGGYKIITTLDPKLQDIAMKEILSRRDVHDSYALGAVFIEPGTGYVKSMAVNRNYDTDTSGNHEHSDPSVNGKGTYPNTVNPVLGGGTLGYQAGSTFKMFTMLAALEEGMPLATEFQSPDRYPSIYYGTPGAPSTCTVGGEPRWCPKNASKSMAGERNMWSAFGMSVNTYFVQLIETVGADKAMQMAEKVGIRWLDENARKMADDPETARNSFGAFTLGVVETTPLDVATAYATVAADGKYCEPMPVLKILDRDGKEVPGVEPKCEQVITPDVARAATDAARCPVGDRAQTGSCGGWSTAPGVGYRVSQPVAGKTGTTDSDQAAWFVGYVPKLAGAVFQADPDYRKRTISRTAYSSEVFAATIANYYGDTPMENFPPPPESLATGDMVRVPSVVCRGVSTAKSILEEAGFKVREYPTRVPSKCRAGSVAYTKPGDRAPRNGYVTIFISNGKPPKDDDKDKDKGRGRDRDGRGPGLPPPPDDGDNNCRPGPLNPCTRD